MDLVVVVVVLGTKGRSMDKMHGVGVTQVELLDLLILWGVCIVQAVRQPVPALGSIRVVMIVVTKGLDVVKFINVIFQVVVVMVVQGVFLILIAIIVIVGLPGPVVLVVARPVKDVIKEFAIKLPYILKQNAGLILPVVPVAVGLMALVARLGVVRLGNEGKLEVVTPLGVLQHLNV